MDKIQRATEIHRSMTPHQMALYIVDIDEICTRAAIRINELQDAIELAEEAVRAKHFPAAAKMVPDGWQLVPVKPTEEMLDVALEQSRSIYEPGCGAYLENPSEVYMSMLAAAPKLGGE